MHINKTTLFGVVILPLFLHASEPSAFGAGDLSNPEPYGLTQSEKVILQNKDKLHKIVVENNNQSNQVESLRERIDGIQSVVESLTRKSHNNKIKIEQLNNQNMEVAKGNDEYIKRLELTVGANSESIATLKKSLEELYLKVDKILSNYVSKEDYNSLVDDVNTFKTLVSKELKSGTKESDSFAGMDRGDIYDKAKVYFDNKNYTKSIEYYSYLIEKHYKPAYSHYMIGEMKFQRKNYAEAISYFKKSASLYDKASYMPTLMLHTAISMDKTNDKEHAKAFYQGIIVKFKGTKEAEEAQNYLNQMK